MECVTWTKKLVKKISVFQNDMMRTICGYKRADKIKLCDLFKSTKLEPITVTLRKRIDKWKEKVVSSQRGVMKLCMEGSINGNRKTGRPKMRWEESYKNITCDSPSI